MYLKIPIPLFGGFCYVCYDAKEFLELTGKEVPERTLAICAREKSLAIFLQSKDCLNHELIHLSWYILDFYGVRIDVDNHEALAYLHDSLRDTIESDNQYQSLPYKITIPSLSEKQICGEAGQVK